MSAEAALHRRRLTATSTGCRHYTPGMFQRVDAPDPVITELGRAAGWEPTYHLWSTVCLRDEETVEWLWTHAPEGSYISGFRLVKRTG